MTIRAAASGRSDTEATNYKETLRDERSRADGGSLKSEDSRIGGSKVEISKWTKGPVRYRKYTEEFKVQAIRLAESVGVAAAAKRLGVPDGNLRNWINRGRAGKLESEECAKPVKKSLAEAEAESRRLRRELETTQLDLEIVKRVHRTRYETRAQAKLDIVDWIEGFYNRQRIHSSIGYNTPVGAKSRLMSA